MRLIDADKLMQMIPAEEYNARMAITYAPIVEAEPVRHGRWEIYDTYKQTIDGRTFDGWCECSECRTMYPWDFSVYNYCPHCGAKMDGEEHGKND